MTVATVERCQVHKTWLGKAISWTMLVPAVQVGSFTVWPTRTKTVRTETVNLTRGSFGLDRQAHPQRVIDAALGYGFRPCHPRLAHAIKKMARPRRERHVIIIIDGQEPTIWYAPGHGYPLQPSKLTLEDVRYIPWSVIMAKP